MLYILKEHSDQDWFSTELVDTMKGKKGLENYNIVPSIRRVESCRLVHVKEFPLSRI